MTKKLGKNPVLWGILASAMTAGSQTAVAEDALWTALTSGKVDFSSRIRYEAVDDETRTEDADALTARLTLGYKTGTFHGFGLYGQFEHVEALVDDYSNPADLKPQYPVVADPEGTEVNQGYLFYNGLPNTSVKVGRQILTYRKAPFHRFVGTVAWRQNWQTQDAFSISNTSIPGLQLSYAYSWNINRIFGEDAPAPLDDFTSDSHFINAQYTGIKGLNLEAYAYLLDFDNAAAFSTNTYGIRASGAFPLSETTKLLYAGEFAKQDDAANNPNSIDANYYLAEIGAKFGLSGPFKALVLKAGYELQEGNGGADRFVTILGTNHAYQGWADKFLVTPGDGVEDIYFLAILQAFGAKFIAAYHDFSSDNGSYDYGSEFDLLAVKKFNKNYTVGLKYADYEGDKNAQNLGGQRNDISKFWAFFEVKF